MLFKRVFQACQSKYYQLFMNQEPGNQGGSDGSTSTLESFMSSYEIAVLSTLFDQEDSGKVVDLADQWGYGEEFLQSVWRKIHCLSLESKQGDDHGSD